MRVNDNNIREHDEDTNVENDNGNDAAKNEVNNANTESTKVIAKCETDKTDNNTAVKDQKNNDTAINPINTDQLATKTDDAIKDKPFVIDLTGSPKKMPAKTTEKK